MTRQKRMLRTTVLLLGAATLATSHPAKLDDVPLHVVSLRPDGRVGMERWSKGDKFAMILTGPAGTVFESRSDGRRSVHWMGEITGGRAIMMDKGERRLEGFQAMWGPHRIEELLAATPGKWEGPVLEDGRNVWTLPVPGGKGYRAEADPATGRLLTTVEPGGDVSQFTYPADIPDSTFAPRLQTTKAVPYDLSAERRRLSPGLRKGLARRGDVTLRMVARDLEGKLWVLWTGAPADGPVRLIGLKAEPTPLTSLATKGRFETVVSPLAGVRVEGAGFALAGWGPDEVTVEIPTASGTRRFDRVRVRSFLSLSFYLEDLGLTDPDDPDRLP